MFSKFSNLVLWYQERMVSLKAEIRVLEVKKWASRPCWGPRPRLNNEKGSSFQLSPLICKVKGVIYYENDIRFVNLCVNREFKRKLKFQFEITCPDIQWLAKVSSNSLRFIILWTFSFLGRHCLLLNSYYIDQHGCENQVTVSANRSYLAVDLQWYTRGVSWLSITWFTQVPWVITSVVLPFIHLYSPSWDFSSLALNCLSNSAEVLSPWPSVLPKWFSSQFYHLLHTESQEVSCSNMTSP